MRREQRTNYYLQLLENSRAPFRRTTATRTSCTMPRAGRTRQLATCPPISTPRNMRPIMRGNLKLGQSELQSGNRIREKRTGLEIACSQVATACGRGT